MIHPSAVIDPAAQIGAETEIGPCCVIGADVVIGSCCVLASHVTVAGPTTIGAANHFFPYSSIGQRSQDLKYSVEPTYLEIGDHNSFREFCTVNRGTAPGSKTRIGSHNNFLAYSHVAHDCTVGNHTIFSNNGTLAGHVIVEDHAVIGGLSGVHQFCRIGCHAIIGGCTKIVKDSGEHEDGEVRRREACRELGGAVRRFGPGLDHDRLIQEVRFVSELELVLDRSVRVLP